MDQADRLVDLVRDVLASDLLGAYLFGSAVDGGLRPASDVDVLAVSRRPLGAGERRRLVDGLLAARPGDRPPEVTVVVQADVRPWRYPPTADLLYGAWLREEVERSGPPGRHPLPGLAIAVTQVLATGRVLAGPPAADLLDPVPARDVVRAAADDVPALVADLDDDTRNVLLTLARVWSTLVTGRIEPKDVAAGWALDRLPAAARPPLAHARQLYLTTGYRDETWTDGLRAAVRPCADALLAGIRAAQARTDGVAAADGADGADGAAGVTPGGPARPSATP